MNVTLLLLLLLFTSRESSQAYERYLKNDSLQKKTTGTILYTRIKCKMKNLEIKHADLKKITAKLATVENW